MCKNILMSLNMIKTLFQIKCTVYPRSVCVMDYHCKCLINVYVTSKLP